MNFMDFAQYELIFREKARASGFSEDNINACLTYAKPLIDRNLPVIFNTSNLAALVGYKTQYLKRAALYTNYFYRNFTITKANGKLRTLKEPLPSLKEVQIWILQNILYSDSVTVSKYAKAYVKKRSLLDNAKWHKGKDKVLTIDVSNFFGSITRDSVENIFKKLGYSYSISNLLSKLCCCDDCLPQGAPTSPVLSNVYMFDFDSIISKYCSENNLRYTRYADDLTFSGNFEEGSLVSFVRQALLKFSLILNEDKTKLMKRNQRQLVTGILVNEIMQVPKRERLLIRQEIYYIEKFGLNSHLEKTNNKRRNYLPHLLGKINYALFLNPKDEELLRYKKYIQNLYLNSFHF